MTRSLDIQTPLGVGAFVMAALSGHEGLSALSRFQLTLKCKRPDIDAAKMLGQNVTVRVEGVKNTPRYFNGYITRWSGVNEIHDSQAGGKETKAYLYEATMSPWLWFLTRSSNSRIFQDQTVPGIVEAVFKAHGPLASFKMQLKGVYPKRDLTIVRGKDAVLWDEAGREYIDCVGGQGVSTLGHANEAVVHEIERAERHGIVARRVDDIRAGDHGIIRVHDRAR